MRLNQVTVGTTDVGRAEEFYRLLGLRLIVKDDHYLRFECPDGESTFSVELVAPETVAEKFETKLIDYAEELRALIKLQPSDARLTSREWDVLTRVAEGKTNRAVAGELFISVETVRTHVSNILAKLQAPNRSAAAAKYHQLVRAV